MQLLWSRILIKKMPFWISSILLFLLSGVWSLQERRFVYLALFVVYLIVVLLNSLVVHQEIFLLLVKKSKIYGTVFFLWFFVLLFSAILIFVIVNILRNISNNSQFTWRVLIFVSTGVWISSIHALFLARELSRKK